MYEDRFLKTMIEYIKYEEDIDNKNELLTILRCSSLSFDKTRIFATKSYQYWEDINIRVPIPMLKKAREHKAQFEEIAKYIYKETDEYDLKSLVIKPKIIDSDENTVSEHDVVFDKIKETIIQGIRSAKYIIWVAVAWITDREIYDELIAKKKVGVNIRIITSDETTNRFLIDDLEREFDTIRVPCWGESNRNRLHDKFCIIDFEYVMHGSYNWSKNAQNNKETLSTAIDRDFVRKFLDQFISLYNEYKLKRAIRFNRIALFYDIKFNLFPFGED